MTLGKTMELVLYIANYKCYICYPRAINGVKDMEGYRHTLNLSAEGNISNETGPCNTSQDDVETTAILVGAPIELTLN